MPPKKGKKGKKKGKKGGDIMNEPDNFKSLNVAERQVLQGLYDKMRRLKKENEDARAGLMGNKDDMMKLEQNQVSEESQTNK